MPQFRIVIDGEDLAAAREALDRAGIPSIGPAFAWFTERPEGVSAAHRMLAVLDAGTPEEAEARVRDSLPVGDYVVERAGRWQTH